MRSRTRTTGIAMVSFGALVGGLLAVPTSATADDGDRYLPRPEKIAAELSTSFETDATQDLWITVAGSADNTAARNMADWNARGTQVAANLRAAADASQAPIRARLDAAGVTYQTFWITNAIHVDAADRALALELTAIPAVSTIFNGIEIVQDEPFQGTQEPRVGAVEWGIADIKADDFWSEFDTTGEGVVVANIDTGVSYTHPALINQYRGNEGGGDFDHNYNWYDPAGATVVPTDGDIHGTHTMGTIVGGDGGANQIGVAPGAKWIASNALMRSIPQFLDAMEWMLEPRNLAGQNPDASKRPHIISNSWGISGVPTDPFGDDIQQAWIDSGIFGTWSNRNLGPGCNTTGSPGGRALSYSNGAYDINHTIASFSSRGPGQDGMTKPNISGPGVNVRSSVPGGGYSNLSGTSMSTPHLAGAVALLWSAAPALIGDIEGTRDILNESAIDTSNLQCGGTAKNNNVFGEGRLDVLAAGALAPIGESGAIKGVVKSKSSGDKLKGIKITLKDGTSDKTDAKGKYAFAAVPNGKEKVTASGKCFQSQTKKVKVDGDEKVNFKLAAKSC